MLREAQAAARLNHPGIVTLYEIGEEDGNALLVTELVDGSTLARAQPRRRRSATARSARSAPTSARRSTTPTRAASSTATSSRRTSSSPRSGEPRAKLMDFGVARLADAAALTAPGDVVGTLAYMAPEQAEGRSRGPRGRRLRAGADPL